MISIPQALQRFREYASEIPQLYPRAVSDYRGRIIDADSVRQYLEKEKDRFVEMAAVFPDPPQKGSRLLDVGIAYGFLANLLKTEGGWGCEGLELKENISVYCSFARAHGIPVHSGGLGVKPLPFADAGYEAVIFSEVLEHLRLSPTLVFRELRRILVSKGLLLVTTPNMARLTNLAKLLIGRNILEPFPEDARSENITEHLTHIREYTMREICLLLTRCGFSIRRAWYSRCMEQGRPYRWLTTLIPPWRGSLFVLAQKKA